MPQYQRKDIIEAKVMSYEEQVAFLKEGFAVIRVTIHLPGQSPSEMTTTMSPTHVLGLRLLAMFRMCSLAMAALAAIDSGMSALLADFYRDTERARRKDYWRTA